MKQLFKWLVAGVVVAVPLSIALSSQSPAVAPPGTTAGGPVHIVDSNGNSLNPLPVSGSLSTTQSGPWTVGINPNANTVKLDPANNSVTQSGPWTVGLDSTDSNNLSNINSKLGQMKFDSNGNLVTASPQPAEPSYYSACIPSSDWDGTYSCDLNQTVGVTYIGVYSATDHIRVDLVSSQGVITVGDVNNEDKGFSFTYPIPADAIHLICRDATSDCAAGEQWAQVIGF